jgi:hypothetical protein
VQRPRPAAGSPAPHPEEMLRRETHHGNARADAESFASAMPWLTPDQRRSVVGLYITERIALARHTEEAFTEAFETLRTRHAGECARLRRRMNLAVLLLLSAVTLSTCALLLQLL